VQYGCEDTALVAPSLLFPPLKFQLRLSLFVRLKTLVASGLSWLLLLAVDHIYGINMEQL
jgi:hypothetical protein